jgi:hypothetical protein
VIAPLLFLFLVQAPTPPTYIGQTKFQTGQDVVPSYEGWLRNADGTATMVFGYLNRNWSETPAIPAGPDNKLEPGPVDQGQPTFFLPRRQAFIFRAQVAKDWGQKELIWSITANGRTEKAYGTLSPDEEITERMIMTRGGLSPGEDDPNRPPVISIARVEGAMTTTLTALVTDDGLPKPRPAPRPKAPGTIAQTNSVGPARPRGLNVTWLEYRGPAKVTFDSAGPILVKEGSAQTTAHFPGPGTYVLQAIANDGELSVRTSVTIDVR